MAVGARTTYLNPRVAVGNTHVREDCAHGAGVTSNSSGIAVRFRVLAAGRRAEVHDHVSPCVIEFKAGHAGRGPGPWISAPLISASWATH